MSKKSKTKSQMRRHSLGREWTRKKYPLGERLHRKDGPAVELDDGSKRWYFNGLPHRDDGPAVEQDNRRYWYKYGSAKQKPTFRKERT